MSKKDEAARRVSYASSLTHRTLEALCEVRDFACSNAKASWMPEDEIEYWDTIEIKAESIRGDLDSLLDIIKKRIKTS